MAEAPAVHHTRGEVVDDDVGMGHQVPQQRLALVGPHVDDDGALAPVDHLKHAGTIDAIHAGVVIEVGGEHSLTGRVELAR